MISEDARERMRRSYYLEKKSLRQIAREEGYCRETIKKAISDTSPRSYDLTQPRPAIVLGHQDQIEIDHITPKSQGGGEELSNKLALHRHCHDQRHAKHDRVYQ